MVSDPVYRPSVLSPFPLPFSRQALHAQALGFIHPFSDVRMRIEAPQPSDLDDRIAGLRHRYGGP